MASFTLRNLMQSFSSLFLVIPHTAARYYGDLRARAGTDVFNESHHPAYYYSAAYAFCKLNQFFLSQQLDRQWKPARYFLLAGVISIVANTMTPEAIQGNEKRAEIACSPLNELLWDDHKYLTALQQCNSALGDMISSPEQIREAGRSRDFTEQYLRKLIVAGD